MCQSSLNGALPALALTPGLLKVISAWVTGLIERLKCELVSPLLKQLLIFHLSIWHKFSCVKLIARSENLYLHPHLPDKSLCTLLYYSMSGYHVLQDIPLGLPRIFPQSVKKAQSPTILSSGLEHVMFYITTLLNFTVFYWDFVEFIKIK